MKNEKGFFSLLGLLFIVVAFLFVCLFVFKFYWVRPVLDKRTIEEMSSQNIDTSSYQSVQETTKKKIEEINKQYEKQLNGMVDSQSAE